MPKCIYCGRDGPSPHVRPLLDDEGRFILRDDEVMGECVDDRGRPVHSDRKSVRTAKKTSLVGSPHLFGTPPLQGARVAPASLAVPAADPDQGYTVNVTAVRHSQCHEHAQPSAASLCRTLLDMPPAGNFGPFRPAGGSNLTPDRAIRR